MYISNNGKFKEGIVWWDTEIDPSADVDIFFYIHDYEKRADNSYGFKSLEINLKNSIDGIRKSYKSNLRNELRKSPDLNLEFTYLSELSKEGIDNYVNEFNSFADFKKIQRTSQELISQMVKDKKLVVSKVFKDGELITVHSHYVDGNRARLYHSYSVMNSFSSSIGALANKALTDKDIFHFKDKGYQVYDFGGVGNVDGDNSIFEGIIRFKKQFGGKEVILWKGTTLNGDRGKAVYEKYFNHNK